MAYEGLHSAVEGPWRRLALALGLVVLAAGRVGAEPIDYIFKGKFSFRLDYDPMHFEEAVSLQMTGRLGDVNQRPSGAHFNSPDGGMQGTFSGFGQTLAVRERFWMKTERGGFSRLIYLMGAGSTASGDAYLGVHNSYANVPELADYQLGTTIGPVAHAIGVPSEPGIDLSELFPAMTSAGGYRDVSFSSTLLGGDAIEYRFNWIATGAFNRPSVFQMDVPWTLIVRADTDDVEQRASGRHYIGIDEGLTGQLTARGKTIDVPNLALSTSPGSYISLTGPGGFDLFNSYLNIQGRGFPGIDDYDLRSSFGPVSPTNLFDVVREMVFDFSPFFDPSDGSELLGFTVESFEARTASTIPEPAAMAVLPPAVALLLMLRTRRRRR